MASGFFGPGPIICINCSLHRCVQAHLHQMAVRPEPPIGIPPMMNLVDLGRRPHNTLKHLFELKWFRTF